MNGPYQFSCSCFREAALACVPAIERCALYWQALETGLETKLLPPRTLVHFVDCLADLEPEEFHSRLSADSITRLSELVLEHSVASRRMEPLTNHIRRLSFLLRIVDLPNPVRMRVAGVACVIAVESGRIALAESFANMQRHAASIVGDVSQEVTAGLRIAMSCYRSDPNKALEGLDAVLVAHATNDQDLVGRIEINRAIVLMALGRYEDALQAVTLADRINRKYGYTDRVCSGMLTHANLLKALGEYDACEKLLRELIEFSEVVQFRRATAAAVGSLGSILKRKGRLAEAFQQYQTALVLFDELEDELSATGVRSDIALVRVLMNGSAPSVQLLEESTRASIEIGLADCAVRTCCACANVHLDSGDEHSALRASNMLGDIGLSAVSPESWLRIARVKARILMHKGATIEAETVLREAIAATAGVDALEDFATAQCDLAAACAYNGNHSEAILLAINSYEIAEKANPQDCLTMLFAAVIWAKSSISVGAAQEVEDLTADIQELLQRRELSEYDCVGIILDAKTFVAGQRASHIPNSLD